MAEAITDYPTGEAAEIVLTIQKDYVKWSEENPAIALAASAIGPAVGIGQIAAAQVIALYRDWIG